MANRTKSIVKNLTENYAALQAHYQAAYLAWCGNPCSHESQKTFEQERKRISDKEFALKSLEEQTKKLQIQAEKKAFSLYETPKRKTKAKKERGVNRTLESLPEGVNIPHKIPAAKKALKELKIPEKIIDEIQKLVDQMKV